MSDFIKFQDKYIEDAGELIVQLEEEVLHLEENPKSKETIQEIFRLMHTLKGSAGMFGFDKTASLTHLLETIYDQIRSENLQISTIIIDLTFNSIDIIKLLLTEKENLNNESENRYNELLRELSVFTNDNAEVSDIVENMTDTNFKKKNLFYIIFKPQQDVFTRGIRPLSAFEELSDLGSYLSYAHCENIPVFSEYNRKNCYIFWEIFLKAEVNIEEVQDVFLFFLTDEYEVIMLENNDLANNEEFLASNENIKNSPYNLNELSKKLNNFLTETTTSTIDSKSTVEQNETLTQSEISEGVALIEENLQKKTTTTTDAQISTIKVSSEKLDELINLVSELVTVNSQLELISTSIEHQKLNKAVQTVSKLSKRFRNNALDLRLVPINVLIIKFQRMVRDLSKKLNKDVDFITEGLDTELDKTIITKLESPLMHIIRNSLDHGIEDPDKRINKGKPGKGIIRFIAFYSGANVFIQIQDDGQGIDKNKIMEKAVDNNFIKPNTQLTEKEIYDLIFLPGFSTAQSLTQVSGRGVGMDVVRQKISELRGEIDIDSEINLGTSVTLKLPLTLSIIDTMLVKVAKWSFLLPVSSIEICRNYDKQIIEKGSRKNIEYNDELIPVISLRNEFNIKEEYDKKEKIVIIKQIDKRYAIVVDEVIGEHQAVFKRLGFMHKKQEYLAGASILGDGSLALILDTNKLVRKKRAVN